MNKKIKILIVILGIFFLGNTVSATELFFYSPQKDWFANFSDKTISVYVNTQKQTINALEGEIKVSGVLDVVGISLGNSVVPLWIEEPKLTDNNIVRFAGIIPGGLEHYSGLLFKLIVKNNQAGDATFSANNFIALLHDGLGTAATTSIKNLELKILPESEGENVIEEKKDITSPEDFNSEVVSDQNLNNGQWTLIFQTQDKDSGVDYYLVQETRYKKIIDKNWQVATSPYELRDQGQRSYIYIKAVDREGNERLELILPKFPLNWWEDYRIWVIIIVGGLLPLVYLLILIKRILKH